MASLPDRSSPDDPEPLSASLERLVRDLGVPGVDVLRELTTAWTTIVGPELASCSRPVELRHGRLVVVTDDSATAVHLRWASSDLVSTLSRRWGGGAVERLELRVQPPTGLEDDPSGSSTEDP